MNTQALVGAVIAAVLGTGTAAVVTNIELLNAPTTNTIERASDVLVTEIVEPDNLPYPSVPEVAPAPTSTVEDNLPAQPETAPTPVDDSEPTPLAPTKPQAPAPTPAPPDEDDDHDDEDEDEDDEDDDDDD